MTKHTPGPWTNDDRRIIDAEGWLIAELDPEYTDDKNAKHDAALIAAAPDLLAALVGLFEHCAMTHKHWGEGCNQREADAAQAAARAAIAKAQSCA